MRTSNMILVFSWIFLMGSGLMQVVAQIPGTQSGLKITEITFSYENPMEGEEVTISAVIANSGPRPMENITVNYLLDQMDEIGSITDIDVGSGDTMNVSITWIAQKWDHNITALLVMGGNPLMDTALAAGIKVQAEPIGDVQSLFITLALIMLVILAAVVAPSFTSRMKGRPSR